MKYSIILSAAGFVLLNSCSTKFSAEQRSQLSTVRISQASQKIFAYQNPQGAADGTSSAVAAATTGGSLLGFLIGETVASTQNSMFKNAEGAKFGKLHALSPKSLSPEVTKNVTEVVKQNPFFGSRLRNSSPNQIRTEILSYGLTRTGKNNQGLLLSPKVVVDVQVLDENGKNIGMKIPFITSISPMSHNLSTYIANPKLLQQGYNEASYGVKYSLAAELARRTEE